MHTWTHAYTQIDARSANINLNLFKRKERSDGELSFLLPSHASSMQYDTPHIIWERLIITNIRISIQTSVWVIASWNSIFESVVIYEVRSAKNYALMANYFIYLRKYFQYAAQNVNFFTKGQNIDCLL